MTARPPVIPWWERWASLSERSYPSKSLRTVNSAIDIAGWFVENHADDSSPHGWRPVHIMHPAHGLAWRWVNLPTEPILTFAPRLIRAVIAGHDFLYRAERDGTAPLLFGADRDTALAAFYD